MSNVDQATESLIESENLQSPIRNLSSSNLRTHKRSYLRVDELFGKILGIERVLLCNRSDTLLEVIEKINLIPEHKLLVVEPIAVKVGEKIIFKPKVMHVISLTDVLAVF